MIMIPAAWPCNLSDCPAGFFVPQSSTDLLCFKTVEEWRAGGMGYRAYDPAGELYCGEDEVIPVKMVAEDERT